MSRGDWVIPDCYFREALFISLFCQLMTLKAQTIYFEVKLRWSSVHIFLCLTTSENHIFLYFLVQSHPKQQGDFGTLGDEFRHAKNGFHLFKYRSG